MTITRHIYVSLPADARVPANLNALKWGVVDEIERHGYAVETFTAAPGRPARPWSPDAAETMARRCVGAVILGVPRWRATDDAGREVLLPSEINHYDGALVHALGLPTLVLTHRGAQERVVFGSSYCTCPVEFPLDADASWVGDDAFQASFATWTRHLAARRDVFLGYCSCSTTTAQEIKRFLVGQGVSVLDWQTDFAPGRSILEQIEEASRRSTAGIFLFTKDDALDAPHGDGSHRAAPRDNVVFEAGYFCGTKRKRNVMIVLEDGSTMPADLGGDVFVPLADRNDISTITRGITRFVEQL